MKLCGFNVGLDQRFFLIAGPCVIESEQLQMDTAGTLKEIAGQLGDLRVPPGNRLEKLTGDRAGEWSIRVNDQWRICFVWGVNGPKNVEIVDYH